MMTFLHILTPNNEKNMSVNIAHIVLYESTPDGVLIHLVNGGFVKTSIPYDTFKAAFESMIEAQPEGRA